MPGHLRLSRHRSKSTRSRLNFERLEERFVLNGQAILGNDVFSLHENGPQATLHVLANDVFDADYAGNRLITSVSFGSQGGRLSLSADKQSLLYTPPADFFGAETFTYAVDGTYTAQVSVTLDTPLAFDDFTVTPNGQTRQLDVLANDPFWAGYTGPRKITAVSVGSAGGTVAISADRKSILYTSPDDVIGDETFTYVVDDLYPARVTIHSPSTLFGDSYELVKHTPPTVLHVLDNDPFWEGYTGAKKITQVTQSWRGATITISNDGKSLLYTQPADYADGEFTYVLYDSFEYVVDGVSHAGVTVGLLRPVKEDSFEMDQDGVDQSFNVTQNDRYGGSTGDAFDMIDRVTSVTQSVNGGTVSVSPDGQSVIYTPAPGFSGTDTFTYTADGVYVARVTVQVTRPVRDDAFYTGIYQDTPDKPVEVLANDFLSTGYSGAKLITSVGPTEHGGTVTIRNDGKAVLYTPAAGYTGEDRFTYTVDGTLQAGVTVNVIALAQSDQERFYPEPSQRPYTIDVLENDNFSRGYLGPGAVTSAEVVDGIGSVSVRNDGKLLFSPSSAGAYTIRYTVDGQYEANVFVWVANVAFADQFVADQNSSSQQLDVLINDFYLNYYPDYYSYQGPRIITGVTQSQHGGTVTITADGHSVRYTPGADFFGTDTFTYTVDGFMTATVSVEVIRRVRDDVFRVDAGDGTQSLPVLVNDLFGANYSGPGQITAVGSPSAGGVATIAADGHSIVYKPKAGFVGTDHFIYTVDGQLKAEVTVVVDAPPSDRLPTFGSVDNYKQFLLNDALTRYEGLFGQRSWGGSIVAVGGSWVLYNSASLTDDRIHSETNVQVDGVDEGDIVEFDSDYAYVLNGSDLVIVDAWPAENLSVASRVHIDGQPIAEFLHGDRLTVISRTGGYVYGSWNSINGYGIDIDGYWPLGTPIPASTIVTVIDVSNRSAPTVVQKTTMQGNYVESRAVGDFVYVLVNNANAVAPQPKVIDDDNDPQTPGRYETREEYIARITAEPGELIEAALPNYTSYGPNGEMARTGLLNTPENIYQPLVATARNLLSVVSFNVESHEPGIAHTSAVYSTGASTVYASLDNFYVFDNDSSREDGGLTRIVKFDWEPSTGGIQFDATTTVPGTILNQFSADESGSYLRIATTVSNYQSGNWSGRSENMLFVLREDDGVFESVGSLQNLALNESMRSIRFMGDRAFVTTFRAIDPLFAIDLSDPTHPESIGHITLPGFTSYMQLIDQNHLLTVGKNTPAGVSGPTQVSLFDISDLLQPRRIAEYTFEQFTTSEAESDHHAFGYYAELGLLAMPVSRTHVERIDTDGDGYRETSRTVVEDSLAIFTLDVDATDPSARLVLSGEIEHDTRVRRSGFIGDKLYSIADGSVKVVDVSAPGTVIGTLVIAVPAGPPEVLPVLPVQLTNQFTLDVPPAVVPTAASIADPFHDAAEHAQNDLADRLHIAPSAALVVAGEATPDGPGGGYSIVLQVGDQQYLYRAGAGDRVQLIDDDYQFSTVADAWHAVKMDFGAAPAGVAGDYNFDGRVTEQDRAVWEDTNGDWSLTEFLAADGNHDGVVDAADEQLWREIFEHPPAEQPAPAETLLPASSPVTGPTTSPEVEPLAPEAGGGQVSPSIGIAEIAAPGVSNRPPTTATSPLPFDFIENGRLSTQYHSKSRFSFDSLVHRRSGSQSEIDSRVVANREQSTGTDAATGIFHCDDADSRAAVDEAFDVLGPWTMRKERCRSAVKVGARGDV